MKTYIDGEYLVTEYDNGAVVRVINSPPAEEPEPLPNPKSWTKREFVKLFTPAEWSAAKVLAAADPVAEQMMDLIMLSEYISADDPDLIQGLGYFTAADVLASGRAEEILG